MMFRKARHVENKLTEMSIGFFECQCSISGVKHMTQVSLDHTFGLNTELDRNIWTWAQLKWTPQDNILTYIVELRRNLLCP